MEHYSRQKDPLDRPSNRKIPIYSHKEYAQTLRNEKFRCKEQTQVGAFSVVPAFVEIVTRMMMSKMNYCWQTTVVADDPSRCGFVHNIYHNMLPKIQII